MNRNQLGKIIQEQKHGNMTRAVENIANDGKGIGYLTASEDDKVTTQWNEFAQSVNLDESSRADFVAELKKFLNVAVKQGYTISSIGDIKFFWELKDPLIIRFQQGNFSAIMKGNDISTEATLLQTKRNLHYSGSDEKDVQVKVTTNVSLVDDEIFEYCTLETGLMGENDKAELKKIVQYVNDDNSNAYTKKDNRTLYRSQIQLTDKVSSFEQNVTGFNVPDTAETDTTEIDKTYEDCIPKAELSAFKAKCEYIYSVFIEVYNQALTGKDGRPNSLLGKRLQKSGAITHTALLDFLAKYTRGEDTIAADTHLASELAKVNDSPELLGSFEPEP